MLHIPVGNLNPRGPKVILTRSKALDSLFNLLRRAVEAHNLKTKICTREVKKFRVKEAFSASLTATCPEHGEFDGTTVLVYSFAATSPT
jgi:hypothetical protein